jgi:hypothetical protein
VSLLVAAFGDGVGDLAAPQQHPVGLAAVRLVGDQPIRAGAWPARARPGHTDTSEHRGELGGVVDLAGGDVDRQRPAAAVGRAVDLGRQPAT